jgi:diadenosine tetraphosphate (Ap4A) HIT family hydrolase
MKFFNLFFSFVRKNIKDNEDNNNNIINRSLTQSLDKQSNSVSIESSSTAKSTSMPSTSTSSSTPTTFFPTTFSVSTSLSSNTSYQREHDHNRNKNEKYNDDKYQINNNYNNRSEYNNSKLRQHNHSQHNDSQQQQRRHNRQQNNYYQTKKKSYRDPSFVPKKFLFDPYPDSPCKLIDFVGGVNYTPSQDDGLIFNRVVKFFKNIITIVEEENKLSDYNFYLQEDQGLYVRIVQSDPTRCPPRKTLNCLSCDAESKTNRNSKLPYPSTTREEISIHHNLWIDAKARPMFVITPKRHVERLSECKDQEIYSMFLLATQIIEQETRLSDAEWNGIRFIRMTLNHGNARNVEHLHLKIRIDDEDFSRFKNCWDKERKKKFEKLKSGLYRRDERLTKIS